MKEICGVVAALLLLPTVSTGSENVKSPAYRLEMKFNDADARLLGWDTVVFNEGKRFSMASGKMAPKAGADGFEVTDGYSVSCSPGRKSGEFLPMDCEFIVARTGKSGVMRHTATPHLELKEEHPSSFKLGGTQADLSVQVVLRRERVDPK